MFEKTKQKIDAKKRVKEGERLDREQEARCMPVAKYALGLILEADLLLGKKSDEEYAKEYLELTSKIMERFLEDDLILSDAEHVKKMMQEMIDNVKGGITQAVNNALRIAEKDYWGVDKSEATFNMLDEKLKSWSKKEKQKNKN